MKKDDELFVTYGKKCNSRFFVNYGFILQGNNEENETNISINLAKFNVQKRQTVLILRHNRNRFAVLLKTSQEL